ncbi:Putative membrane protein (plasmid) [Amycolatopsis japonica]|uniref:Putative membrane protein n=1 Tax=Amycolatopsis japonica TaxID=208439 RepID=A0A075V791_9PSEU|nr:hypothetical protein [Amycolatopsis japonica]AIG81363.1 Putative membrane protein [Amycolatopsis japonica]
MAAPAVEYELDGESVDEFDNDSRHYSGMTETSTPTNASDADEVENLGWWKSQRIFFAVAGLTLLAGVVIVVTQLNFYREISGLTFYVGDTKIVIWPLIPIMVEGFTWMFGAFATHAVRARTGGEGKFIRWMWFFATIAATVNVWHNWKTTHDPLTAIVLGGASIAAPFLWHSYVGLTSAIVEHRSVDDVKLAAKRRLRHPIISMRADKIQTLLMCDRTTAWTYALVFTAREIHKQVKADLKPRLAEVAPQVGAALPARVVRASQSAAPKQKAAPAKPQVKAPQQRRPIQPPPAPKPIEASKATDQQPELAAETTQLIDRQDDIGTLAPVFKLGGSTEGDEVQEMTLDEWLANNGTPDKQAEIIRTYHLLHDRTGGNVRSYAQVDREAGTNAYAKTVLPGYFEQRGLPNPFIRSQASG